MSSINFENLNKIPEIINKLNTLESKVSGSKRWLNVNETAHYLGYSKDYIHKLKSSSFILGKHYHKKSGKLLFDKLELDNWVTFSSDTKDAIDIVNEVLKDLL
ncbi:MAG: DNA-binding protein [Epsilonproteobacteria bacterium]|nr:MAG: DNA-binding protein [Campylobacterota bacterium]